MKTFTEQEAKEFVTENLKGWTVDQNTLKRDFKFNTFIEAFSFMTAIALEAEKLNHHPDWCNSYNRVSISLTNHEAKGITQLDFELATTIGKFYQS